MRDATSGDLLNWNGYYIRHETDWNGYPHFIKDDGSAHLYYSDGCWGVD